MSLRLNKIILALVFLLCISFVSAFEVNFEAPMDGGGPFGDVMPTINFSTTFGYNLNCSYNLSDGANADIIEWIYSAPGNESFLWEDIDISSLNDDTLTLTAYCVEDVNDTNFNSTSISISKASAPTVTWGNPAENDELSTDDEGFILIAPISANYYPINESDLTVFTVSCDNGDNGSLLGNPIYNMTGLNGDVKQNWTTPSVNSNCSIIANVSNNMSYYDFAIVNVDVINDDRLDNPYVEFGDNEFSMIGNLNEYNLTGLFLEVNSSDAFSFNLTHFNICIGEDEPKVFPVGVSSYNVTEGLWEADPFGWVCQVNISALSEGLNEFIFDIVLNDSTLTEEINYSVYYDPTLPEIHFDWWNTKGWNETDNTTYDLVLPDYMDLIDEDDIFFAPGDEIFIALNTTDDAVFNGTIDRAYAVFDGLDLDSASTCVGQVELEYNDTSLLWEGNCSLGDFGDELNVLDEDVSTGNITFEVFDAYNNTNIFNYYNLSNSSQTCESQSDDCMLLHVPINLHNFGQLGSEDDCMEFNGYTTNLNLEEDFSDINLVLDVWINLSCDYEDDSFPSSMTRLMMFNFSSVDFSTPAAPYKLMNLVDAIDFDFSQAGEFGNSFIFINSSAFEELDTNTTIEMYHLPFVESPEVDPENESHFNSTSVSWVSNGPDPFYTGSPITGNLTFEVFGFSGYMITDNTTPEVNFTNPYDGEFSNEQYTQFNITLNGTGTLISNAKVFLDVTEIANYTYGGVNTANCTEISSGSDTYNCLFGYNITSGDGNYSLSVYVQDFGGDSGNNITEDINFILDTVEPNATMSDTPSVTGWAGDDYYNFTFTLDDDSSEEIDYDFWVVNSTGGDVQPTIYNTTTRGQLTGVVANLTSAIEGDDLTWFLYVMDEAGNGETYNGSFQMDGTDSVSIVSGNHSDWQYNNYSVTITATDTASGVDYIYYEIDDNGVVAINSNTTTFEINESGEYNVTFWSTDVAGNTESNQTFLVKLDNSAPTTTDDSASYSGWQNSDFTVTLTPSDIGTGVNHTNYSINGAANVTGTSVSITSEGEYNVTYYSVDNANQIEDVIKYFTVQLDKTKPTTVVTGNSSDWETAIYNVTLTPIDVLSDVDYTSYSIDGGALQNGTTVEIITDGSYNVTYYSVDNAGNVEDEQNFTVKLDTLTPTTIDDSASYSRWENADFNITLTPTDAGSGVNYTSYNLNGSTFTNGTTIEFVSEGDFNVTYYSVDNSGRTETANEFSIGLDKTAPTTTDNSGSFGGIQSSAFNVTLSPSDTLSGVSYTNYSINNGANQTGTIVAFTSEGEYNVTYYSVDSAGNIEVGNDFTVQLDNTAPSTTDDAPNGWQNSDFTITLSPTDGFTGVNYTSYSVNGSALTNGTSISISSEGEYNVTYYSVDNADNTENVNTVLVQLDKTAPTATDNSASFGGLQNEAFNVTITATDTLSGIAYINYTINDSSNMTLSGTEIPFTSEGEYNVTYYAVDNAGHLSSEGNFSVSLDNTAPVTTDNAPNGWQTSDFTITLSANDGLTGVNHTSYSIDGSTLTNGTSISISTEGEYNVTYYSVDNAGNIESTNIVLVQLDKTEPTLNITAPLNQTYTSSNLTVSYTATDVLSDVNVSSCLYDLGGPQNVCPEYIDELGDGTHTLIINITDNAGNSVAENVTFTVQESPSYTKTKVRLPIEYNETNNYWFNITLIDNSAIDLGRLNLNGTWHDMTNRGSGLWTYNETNLSSGTYSYYYWANDTSNNTWQSATSSFVVRALETYEEVINESDFEVPVNVTNVIVDELQNVSIPSGSTATVTLDLSNSVSNGEVTLDNPVNLKREGSTVNYSVEIPAGTKLNASSSWDGKLTMPEVDTSVSATEAPSGKNGTVDLTLKVGSDDVEISFDKPVKILLQGQANKSAAWKRGSSSLTEITTTCDSATNPTNINSVNPRICKVNSGSDLVIWTYHFTTFASGTWSTTPTPTSPPSGGGGSRDDTYELGTLNLGESVGQKLQEGDDIEFSMSNGNHNLELGDIDYSNRKITVTIQSTPKVIDMDEFVVYRVDTDDNGVYDLKAWFEFVTSSTARVYLMEIEEKVEEDVSISPVQKVETEVPPETKPENIDVITNDDSSNNVDTQNDFVMEDNTVKDNIAVEEETSWGVIITVVLVLLGIIGLIIYMLYNK